MSDPGKVLDALGERPKRAAVEALLRHDDRAAMHHLIEAIKSPNPVTKYSALIDLQILFQRVRGADGFLHFCRLAQREELVPDGHIRYYNSIGEFQKLSEDITAGEATAQQGLQVLATTHEYFLARLSRRSERGAKLEALSFYVGAIGHAATLCESDDFREFCKKQELSLWADNERQGCLLPVVDVRELLEGEIDGKNAALLPGVVTALRLSLRIHPHDPESTDLLLHILESVASGWSKQIQKDVGLWAAARAALLEMRGLTEVDQGEVEEALAALGSWLPALAPLEIDELASIAVLSTESGSSRLLAMLVEGQDAYYQGDYSRALRVFDRLLDLPGLGSSPRAMILQWSIASALGRIKACSAFGFSPRALLLDCHRRLRMLGHLEEDQSPASARFFLDFALAAAEKINIAKDDVRRSRRVLAEGMHDFSSDEILESGWALTLVSTSTLVDVGPAELLAEAVECTRLPVLQAMLNILQGKDPEIIELLGDAGDVSCPIPTEKPETEEAVGETTAELEESENSGPAEDDDDGKALKDVSWYRQVLKGASPADLSTEFKNVVGGLQDERDQPNANQVRRLQNARLAVEVATLFVRTGAFQHVFELLVLVRKVANGDTEEEQELLFQTQSLRAQVHAARREDDEAYEVLVDLQTAMLGFISDRVAGELSLRTRNLLGHVSQEVARLKPD